MKRSKFKSSMVNLNSVQSVEALPDHIPASPIKATKTGLKFSKRNAFKNAARSSIVGNGQRFLVREHSL